MAAEAAMGLLGLFTSSIAEAGRIWLSAGRDRWLATDGLKAWEFWLYAIREFWLKVGEEAEASGANIVAFEKIAEQHGYVPGVSAAIGKRVWSIMVTQRKSLSQVFREMQLSTGQEIDRFEEPAGWIQDGKIAHCFKSFAYFCGVLASQRARDIELAGTRATSITVGNSGLTFGLLHFQYRYPQGFNQADETAIEAVRLKANETAAAKVITPYEDLSNAKDDWVWELASGAAPVFGAVATRSKWAANKRRDTFAEYIDSAAASAAYQTSTREIFRVPKMEVTR